MTDKEKIDRCINELEQFINYCDTEAKSSLNNEVCHISLKFTRKLLTILKDDKYIDTDANKINEGEIELLKPINAAKNGKLKLEWYVLNHDFNTEKIYNFNVLQHGYLLDLIRMIEEEYYNVHDYESLKECIKRWANYNFNHKTECEIFVHGWFDKEDKETKISIYDQLEPNLEVLTEYINRKLQLFEV